ncbi:MAG: sigma-70 family RNA polymerase sigma factor, partial [Planctomycetes bacterium]|nr:sigma-70 family RNA polymerase sigma factor [Planctomycetota bacterium]
MAEGQTTAAVQRYLDALAGDRTAEPIVRELLGRSAARLRMLAANLLHRSYPRLARPPLNLDHDELVSAVVERLLKALRTVKPGNVRQFFALANQHMRWELNEFARRLDAAPREVALNEHAQAPAPQSASASARPSPAMTRILGAIDALESDDREVLELVRIQGMTHVEAAGVLGVSTKTVQRRLNRALVALSDGLGVGAVS